MAKSTGGKDLIGKGLRSLLENINSDLKNTEGHLKSEVVEQKVASTRVPVGSIEANPRQPRNHFDEPALEELAQSIRLHDIIQPLTVSPLPDGKFRLIAGERRFRAAKLAGLKDVPVYFREANDAQLLELALLENLQRENLNAMEIALSYKRMVDDLHYTQDEVAERMGKERSTVANYIRLLKLPPDIQVAVRSGDISMGHARAIINVAEVEKQLFIFNEIKNRHLSVRQTEELVRRLYTPKQSVKKEGEPARQPAYHKLQDTLATYFSTKVHVKQSKSGKGSITLEYYSMQELNKLLEQMGVTVS
jgi:ParB family transcriptional regulator, chromosome partitioning protein